MGFGNKGAVMVRMRVFDEPLAAVCAHLASGDAPADALKRQADFMQICRTGTFGAAGDEGQTILHAPLEADPTCAPQPAPLPHNNTNTVAAPAAVFVLTLPQLMPALSHGPGRPCFGPPSRGCLQPPRCATIAVAHAVRCWCS